MKKAMAELAGRLKLPDDISALGGSETPLTLDLQERFQTLPPGQKIVVVAMCSINPKAKNWVELLQREVGRLTRVSGEQSIWKPTIGTIQTALSLARTALGIQVIAQLPSDIAKNAADAWTIEAWAKLGILLQDSNPQGLIDAAEEFKKLNPTKRIVVSEYVALCNLGKKPSMYDLWRHIKDKYKNEWDPSPSLGAIESAFRNAKHLLRQV